MKTYQEMSLAERRAEYAQLLQRHEAQKALGLQLNMARGKPGREQLDMVMELLTLPLTAEDFITDGVDARNYGVVEGIPAARRLFAELLGCQPEQVIAGGNSSLEMMFDAVSKAYTHGLLHSEKPWGKLERVKWLCPAPGYDRHFKISESFGMELLTVPMTEEGPDMDVVEQLIRDPEVKGMWNVPKYSNPTGITYSARTVQRLAAMKPAAPDFMLMWDNAYCVHELEGDFVPFPDILSLCAAYGNADMAYEFASTSKITFPGAGVAAAAMSQANVAYMTRLLNIQIISYDKMNQLRHVRYLQDKEHTVALMQRHAAILAPKFRAVLEGLERELTPCGIASWSRPRGGYFVSLNALPGTAKRALELCRDAGVTMTAAGATFPYGRDPQDSNIRIAPSLPPKQELEEAITILCDCLRMAALEKLGL